jgi:peroxiredoxin (alkyl hydroperoxide reductase subunit C)
MSSGKPEGCVVPSKGPIVPRAAVEAEESQQRSQRAAEVKMQVMVGKPAPDFEASAFLDGGFKNVTLSAFMGKWVFLCFYPGDFTFV